MAPMDLPQALLLLLLLLPLLPLGLGQLLLRLLLPHLKALPRPVQ